MNERPKTLALREVSLTFGIALGEAPNYLWLAEVEDDKAVALVKVTIDDFLKGAAMVQQALDMTRDLVEEGKNATQN